MNSQNAATAEPNAEPRRQRLFTIESANRALVLVRKVVQDIVDRYSELMRLRAECEELSAAITTEDQLERLQERIEQATDALNKPCAELREIGCDLKDWAGGLIDFPAMHQGRKVWLCWRLGEPTVAHWHELDAGFASRCPIGDDFGQPPAAKVL